jgi:hypothetical protein
MTCLFTTEDGKPHATEAPTYSDDKADHVVN